MPFLVPIVGAILVEAGVSALAASLISTGLSLVVGLIQSKKAKGDRQERQASIQNLNLGESPREALFGTVLTGGQLIYAWNDGGTSNDHETLIIKLADHMVDGIDALIVDDEIYPNPPEDWQPAFRRNGRDHLWLYIRTGLPGDTTPPHIIAASGGRWTSSDKLTGCSYAIVRYLYDEKIWSGGRPRLRFLMRGAKLYDPRKDSTVPGGSGAHRWNNPATYEFSANPIICAYNYRRGIYNNGQLMVGRGLSAFQAPPEAIFAAANICDEAVTLKAGGTQPRYRTLRLVSSDEQFLDVMEDFAGACGGMLVQSAGRFEIQPGVAQTPVATFTDLDLVVDADVQFQGFLEESERCNTVTARYADDGQFQQMVSAPMRRDMADVTSDGRPYETVLELDTVSSNQQAQRCAEIYRRKARLERNAIVTLPPRFSNIEAGDWITWTSDRYLGGDTVTFLVESDDDDVTLRKTLRLREIAAGVFAWNPAVDELDQGQAVPSSASRSALALSGVSATAVHLSGVPAIRLAFTPPDDPTVDRVIVQVRVQGETESTTYVQYDRGIIGLGYFVFSDGVAPGETMEIRARPDSNDISRETNWWPSNSTWGTVSAGDLLVGNVPLGDANRVRLARMELGVTGYRVGVNSASRPYTLLTGVGDGIHYAQIFWNGSASGQIISIQTDPTVQPIPVTAGERLSVQMGGWTWGQVAFSDFQAHFLDSSGAFMSGASVTIGSQSSEVFFGTHFADFITVPAGAVTMLLEAGHHKSGAGDGAVTIVNPMVVGATLHQTVHPSFSPGPGSQAGADVTGDHVAAAVVGQGPVATMSFPSYAGNAAAISGGLATGAQFIDTTDSDTLKTVVNPNAALRLSRSAGLRTGSRSGAGSVDTSSVTISVAGAVGPLDVQWGGGRGAGGTAVSATSLTTAFRISIGVGQTLESVFTCSVIDLGTGASGTISVQAMWQETT